MTRLPDKVLAAVLPGEMIRMVNLFEKWIVVVKDHGFIQLRSKQSLHDMTVAYVAGCSLSAQECGDTKLYETLAPVYTVLIETTPNALDAITDIVNVFRMGKTVAKISPRPKLPPNPKSH